MENMASSELDVMETSMMSQSSILSVPVSLSMREKSQVKRRINKEHNSNFRAGYVPVSEAYLHKVGIRGRKRFLLYCFIIVLLVLAVLNTALTAWLMWIYHISHQGLDPMEFTHGSAGHLLRFLDEAWFSRIILNGGFLGSRSNMDLDFNGNSSKFVLSTSKTKQVEIRNDLIRISVDDLKLVSPTGKQYFSLQDVKIPQLKNLKNMNAKSVETGQVKNFANYDGLSIESWGRVLMTGSLGVTVNSSKETSIEVGKGYHFYVNSTNGTTSLTGHVGIYISKQIPQVAKSSLNNSIVIGAKLCVCGKSGRVFAVAVSKPGMGCASVGQLNHPCLE